MESTQKNINVNMEWTDTHDIYLCREMLAVGIMKTKKKTVHGAQMWETIAQNLCAYDEPKFVVTKRAVRDRYGEISEKYRKRMKTEQNATGISPEQSELDVILEELIERENLVDEETAENKKKVEEEKVKSTEVRKQAMERLADTKRRNEVDDDDKTPRKRRRSGSAAIDFLRSQCEQETKLKEIEMQSRKEEQEVERVRNENAQNRHESLMQMLIQQQQQQQQQTANFQALISQQNQAMLSLMAQLAKK